eukprot:CAMPEP_0204405444 /NCGR_PEP_ID=MMETSP0470-20130426/7358_1 /ASSEMBLY_ACC=CAM_ASM_000385 /TAXON_ID=2969 /ORGANISM="Oxyrrhis marina" /LENGTH=39 /DNA_ID= /DNA_START= /DNA_END= /DNA_ORIENTATION=
MSWAEVMGSWYLSFGAACGASNACITSWSAVSRGVFSGG